MQSLSDSFLSTCKVEKGFRLRGENMTRIEVFVDAAFAFALTMLVISLDEIPDSVQDLIEVAKQIPAFLVCVFQMIWIWYVHSVWSQRFGLEDVKTVILSMSLVALVLIYIYPLKMMFSGFFYWISNKLLPSQFIIGSYDDLRVLFIFFAVGFTLIWLVFALMYRHSLALKEPLKLNAFEIHHCQTRVIIGLTIAAIGLLACLLPLLLNDNWLPFAGFAYSLIGIAYPLIERRRFRQWQLLEATSKK